MMRKPQILFLFISLFVFTVYFNISMVIIMDAFKIGSLTVNGAREERKRAVVFDTAKMKHIDVLFLQETQ